jgi:tRNA (cytidine/uridine-2'-O-)-methyltransferase
MTDHTHRRLHVVLVEPEIHWNTGNAGRTCLAAGAQLHLVEPLGFSLESRELKRAGLDYWKHVDPIIWRSWTALERSLPRLGTPLFLDPSASRLYWDVDLVRTDVLVFGPETRGFPSGLREKYSGRAARIPQLRDTVRSLNLSTCVGILLYETLRQRAALE